jgi:hypothetical protein
MVRAAWVRPGGGKIPDGAKMQRHGIDTLIYDATDPQVDASFLAELRGLHIRVGFTRDPGWTNATGASLADLMDADLKRFKSDNLQCFCVADIEAMWQRGSAFVLEWLTEWRRLRPTRATAWTTEPGQGGTISDELRDRINLDQNLLVVPQLYYSGMVDAVESRVVLDLAARRIRPDRIYPYYDAEDMPAAWDGIVFDFAKLP